MDPQTSAYYRAHAAELAQRYSATSGMEPHFSLAFPPGSRVLDVGAGSGRDVSRLLALGLDAYGVEPCAELRSAALAHYPELAGRLAPGGLPDLRRPFGGEFDGLLCSAVLMHLPTEELFDAAFATRGALKDGGRLLLSVPKDRPGLDAHHRDAAGRLFTPLSAEYLESLFERLGFQLLSRRHSADARPGYSWWELLFALREGVG